jgi:integrase
MSATPTKRLTKKGRARWDVQVYAGPDPKRPGKSRIISRTFNTKKQAEAEINRLEGMRHAGQAPANTKQTFASWMDHWLKVKAGEVRERTIYDYRAIVRRWITSPPEGAPLLGHVRLDRLTTDGFEALYIFMWDQGLSPRSIQYVHSVLRQALKDAASKNKITRNPTDYAKRPKRSKGAEESNDTPSFRAMDGKQAARFLESAREDRYSALWYVLLTGGLRPSEAFGLGWEHVDFEAGRIRVERALTRLEKGGWKLAETKTKRSRRSIPLPSVTMRLLREWKVQQAKERLAAGKDWQDHGFVFATETGTPLEGSNLYGRNFRQIMARAGLGEWGPEPLKPKGQPGPRKSRFFKPAFRMYDLRHTCATLLLLDGESVKVVSERLGHSTVALTMDVYSHVLPTMQEGAAEKLEARFGNG